jgi:hypothetical protein
MILKIIHYLESYKAMQKQYNGKWTHNSFYKDIDNENFCWQIRENRPEKIKIFCNVYKLFKKVMK